MVGCSGKVKVLIVVYKASKASLDILTEQGLSYGFGLTTICTTIYKEIIKGSLNTNDCFPAVSTNS